MNKSINQLVFRALLLALSISAPAGAFAQSTSFTYQGRLQDGGANANGSYDLQFTLWDSLNGGTQQPQPSPLTVTKSSVAVVNGVFTLQLDFGATAFPGADRFLETSVRPAGGSAFTLLAPRQQVTSIPYAIRSASAASADNVPVGAIPAGSGNYIQNSSAQQPSSNFSISGNGTAGGTLSANSVNSSTTLNIAGNKVVSVTGDAIFPTSNTLVGVGAGTKILPSANGDGGQNSFYGFDSGFFNTTGKANSFFGASAGQSNTIGVNNSFFGLQAGYGNTSGANNSFFGFSAGFNSSTGHDNSIFGTNAGLNQSGNYNTYIGGQVGQTTSGDANTFIGFNTGVQGLSSSNTLIGYSAGLGSANLNNATAIGAGAIVSKSNSLVLGTTGTNVGVGTVSPSARLHVVGDTNLVGNVTISGSLKADNINGVRLISAGTQNLFAGDLAGQSNTGQQNSFFGYLSGAFNTAGNFNSFFGVQTGFANTTGSSNSFFGTSAGSSNTTGNFNAFFGLSSGLKNTVGSDNSFFGSQAGSNNIDGLRNSFFGSAAGGQNTSGGANTFVGWAAGNVNSTGSENTILGFNADVASNNLTNATAIGANASVAQNNSLVLGSISGVNNALASANVGIGTTAPSARLHVVGDILFGNKWRTESTTINSPAVEGPPNLIGGLQNSSAGNVNRVTPGVVGAVIGGGGFNGAIQFPSGGGYGSGDYSNRVTDWFGVVGGGFANRAGNDNGSLDDAFFATVGGGAFNIAPASLATVGGGLDNNASGEYSVVGGGAHNIASGKFASIPGGYTNSATAESSFAAGSRAKANHFGTFVWGDESTSADFASSGNNQFLIRAAGGVGIGTSSPVGALNIVGTGGPTQGIQFDNREIKFRGDGIAHFSIFANRVSGNLTIEDTSSNFNTGTGGTIALSIARSSGNVGLGGVTSATSKLQVNGQGRFSTVNIDSYVSGQDLHLCTTASGVNQNIVGLCSSSLRYKTNVQAFSRGLDIVGRLRPISFDWKEAGTHDVGLAAEEVEKVEPLLTFRNQKGEIEGVKYSQLSAVFINAFQEQQALIEQQQVQLNQQAEQIQRQEQQAKQQQSAFAAQQRELDALKKLVCQSHTHAAACRR